MIKLRLPLRDIHVTQPFGVNYFDFYKDMGLPYHPGIDFKANNGCILHASNNGIIKRCGKYSDGGLGIEIVDSSGYSTFYYHLKKIYVKEGETVLAGNPIGECDNTGKYTTGNHLHFELRDNGGNKINPAPYFCYTYNGIEIKPSDYDKSRCYHRYYRNVRNYKEEVRILTILLSKGIFPTPEKINALVYGGWDLESVKNPSLYIDGWSQLKKYDEFLKDKIAYRE